MRFVHQRECRTYRGYVRYINNAHVVFIVEHVTHLNCYVSSHIDLGLILTSMCDGNENGNENGV